ncbi:hypothetical protein ACFZAT_18970 [Streptomyces sp. NPDC008163]|uniref:hypothetical protein n=1 Tax=Streptomyces sp. NPDC008163 TaxID=3364818 RepID=UPI0036E66D4F
MAQDVRGEPAARIEAWADEQRTRARTGRLYLAVPFFLAAGTAPEHARGPLLRAGEGALG